MSISLAVDETAARQNVSEIHCRYNARLADADNQENNQDENLQQNLHFHHPFS
jgi:hypothetical protein